MKTYRKLRGSNQFADIVSVRPEELTLKAIVTLIIFVSVCMWLLTRYMLFVAGNIERVAVRDFSEAKEFITDTFQYQTADSGFYSPVTRAYAYELLHQMPPLPIKSAKDIIFSHKHGDIIYRIYGLESSFGKQDGCLKQGLYNGFGYRQNSSEWMCYKSFQEVTDHVENWIEQHEDLPLGKMLCLYNQGKLNLKCDYNQNFLSL